jgi:hypothetical protein
MQCGDAKSTALAFRIFELEDRSIDSLLLLQPFLGLNAGDIVITSYGVAVCLGSGYQLWDWDQDLPCHPHPSFRSYVLHVDARSGFRWTGKNGRRNWTLPGTTGQLSLRHNASIILSFLRAKSRKDLNRLKRQAKRAEKERAEKRERNDRLSSNCPELWAAVHGTDEHGHSWLTSLDNNDDHYSLRDDLQRIGHHLLTSE